LSSARYAAVGIGVGGGVLVAGGTLEGQTLLTSGELFVATNHPPTAVASVPSTAQGVAGSNTAIVVSGAGSSDPDGDPLTFTWSEGPTTLAVTVDPLRTATIGLPVGVHTLTLTVTDGFGGSSRTTATVTIVDATAGLQAQITSR
jgi:hypothetical protein